MTLALFLSACLPLGGFDRNGAFTVVAAGDTVHPVNEGYLDEFISLGRDMYAPVRHIVSSGDLSFVNIEGPFMDDKRHIEKGGIVFANYPGDLDNLLWAGFNCFSLANNHSLDCGREGVRNTLDLLSAKKNFSRIHMRSCSSCSSIAFPEGLRPPCTAIKSSPS